MSRQTIDYGIDLGTTNSEIARLDGTNIEVFRNAEGFEYTPSAVWIDKQNKLVVGRVAKEWCERELGNANQPGNAFMEFKRDMGSNSEYTVARTGRKMKPEDLSAEVLKALRADVQRRNGDVIEAAVITVPADFDLPACEATKRAALAAGIKHCILVNEPVAAAQAYGFDREEDKTFWLIYDFGGGTFDAAIIQVRDGLIQVVGHGGDNHLGGKNIDWAIVENQFIPFLALDRVAKAFAKPADILSDDSLKGLAQATLAAELRDESNWSVDLLAKCYQEERLWEEISKRIGLGGFRRGAKKWTGAIAKFKIQAEAAKIRLSSSESTEVLIDFLCNDDRSEPVEFNFELKRSELQRLATPFIQRTIHICKETLEKRRLSPGDIAKVILVGGPTMMPFLRDQLKSVSDGLGIPLEANVDPLTVVARGAAVFAGNQHMPDDPDRRKKIQAGQFSVKLDYTPVGPDTDPPVAGVVSAEEGVEKDFTGFTVEFINTADNQLPWRSGKIGLGPKGNFMTNVSAQKGKANTFQVELRDSTGAIQEMTPNTFAITVKGTGEVQITLPHGIGVALANNEVMWFIEAGAVISGRTPLKKRKDLHTAVAIKRGQSGQLIRVPVVEGNKSRADRNRIIGMLTIPGKDEQGRDRPISRDVPAGSEIEVIIEIDQSRLIQTRAFIPILEDDFGKVLPLESDTLDGNELAQRLEKAKDRLKTTRAKVEKAHDPGSEPIAAIQRIDSECMVTQAERLTASAAGDADAGRQCQNLLTSLESTLDDVEDSLEWPELVQEAESELQHTRKMLDVCKPWDEAGKRMLKELARDFEILERETREAIEHRVPDLLRRRIANVEGLGYDVKMLDPGWWVGLLEDTKGKRDQMSDSALATKFMDQGDRAMTNGDFDGLKAAVRGLVGLLPRDAKPKSLSDVTI